MREFARSAAVSFVAVLGAVVLALASTLTSATTLAATTALIMGGTGRPNPDDFPGYITSVGNYYINPNTVCLSAPPCALQGVYTPETAWPVYGGLTALTWKDSIRQGVNLYDAAVQTQLAGLGPDDHLVLFGYSQSGTIMAFEKSRLAGLDTATKDKIQIVVIGDASRPNGGIDSRAYPISVPIVDFPFGPPMATDTGIQTTDIAFKWDIIADAPLYITNPLAMVNALLGFWYVHGTYPNPNAANPNSTPGGYSQAQWQDMMDHPENYPELINIQDPTAGSDTRYLTVTPTVLPLVQPLHDLGLTALADLIEPALRVIIEETGYDRSIPYGTPTSFRLIPIFNPVILVQDLAAAVPQGVSKFVADLRGSATPMGPAISSGPIKSKSLTDNNIAAAKTAAVADPGLQPSVTQHKTPKVTLTTPANRLAADIDVLRPTAPIKTVGDGPQRAAGDAGKALGGPAATGVGGPSTAAHGATGSTSTPSKKDAASLS